MTSAEVVEAIKKKHLKANISVYEKGMAIIQWEHAWVDAWGNHLWSWPLS